MTGRHVRQALEAFDGLISRAGCLAHTAPCIRSREFLQQVAAHDRDRLTADGQTLHDIIGGRMPVLPPDTIDVDYEVIPLIITEGCSYNCRFCRFKTAGGLRQRSWKNIAGQISASKEFYGADLVNYNSLALGQNNALAAGKEILAATAELAYDVLNLAASYHRGRPNLFLFGSVDSFLEAEDSLFDRLEELPYADEPTLQSRVWIEQQWETGRLLIAETKGKGEALLVLDEIQNTVVAIEVKSGSRKEGLPGMDAFDKTFQPQRKLLAGGDGIPLEKFMLTPAAEWVA